MYQGSSNSSSCRLVKGRTDAAEITYLTIAGFRYRRDVTREVKMRVKNKAKITSRGDRFSSYIIG